VVSEVALSLWSTPTDLLTWDLALVDHKLISQDSYRVLLTPQRLDTNSLFLTDQLNGLGVEVITKYVVGDDRELLADTVRRVMSRSRIVILSGGLGPTEDDVTRDAVALALDRKMIFHPEIADQLEQRFRKAGRTLAVATIFRGRESLAAELAMERSQSP